MNTKLELFWRKPTPDKPKIIEIPEGYKAGSNNKDILKPIEEQYNDYIVSSRVIFVK